MNPIESPESNRKSYAVSRYLTSVQRLMREQVPSVWVHGVISQMTLRDRMCYLTLSEYQSGDVKPVASLSLFLFAPDLEAINRKLSLLPKPFRLAQELKVSLLLQADFYIPQGRFQCKVVDIDPIYTLGELALTRQAILARLEQEGLKNRNGALSLSPIPLRVGLITAEGSAAYQDFTTTLVDSGYAFTVICQSARMQGQETESSVLTAMGALQSKGALDVICLVRGGGGKTDLNYFDSEAICRAIALSPVPVLTGIGHEIDQSLADLVAWKACITPTDCARFLVGRVTESWQRTSIMVQNIGRGVQRKLERGEQRFDHLIRSIAQAIPNRIRSEWKTLDRNLLGLRQGVGKIINLSKVTLAPLPQRLQAQSLYRLRHESLTLEVKYQRLRAVDPEQTLKRGYSHTTRANGHTPQKSEDLRSGELLRTRFAWGSILSRVE